MARVMHRLILMRHAQAQPSAPAGGDEARALSDPSHKAGRKGPKA